jgi:hypothetical protein
MKSDTYFAFWIAFGLAEEDEILKEKNVSKSLLSTLPTIELALSQQTALLFDVDVTVSKRIHGQQVVAVTQLKTNHLFSPQKVDKFRFLVTTFFKQLLQQQGVFAHSLDWFEQITRQIHFISQFCLLPLLKKIKTKKKTKKERHKVSVSYIEAIAVNRMFCLNSIISVNTLKKAVPYSAIKASDLGLFLL